MDGTDYYDHPSRFLPNHGSDALRNVVIIIGNTFGGWLDYGWELVDGTTEDLLTDEDLVAPDKDKTEL